MGQEPTSTATDATVVEPTVQETVEAVLAAEWRPPATTLTTEDQLKACRPGTVVTDRDGHPWVLSAAGQWCEPLPTGVDPDELLEWAPLTRHLDGSDRVTL